MSDDESGHSSSPAVARTPAPGVLSTVECRRGVRRGPDLVPGRRRLRSVSHRPPPPPPSHGKVPHLRPRDGRDDGDDDFAPFSLCLEVPLTISDEPRRGPPLGRRGSGGRYMGADRTDCTGAQRSLPRRLLSASTPDAWSSAPADPGTIVALVCSLAPDH